jgi:hypothetical protein
LQDEVRNSVINEFRMARKIAFLLYRFHRWLRWLKPRKYNIFNSDQEPTPVTGPRRAGKGE